MVDIKEIHNQDVEVIPREDLQHIDIIPEECQKIDIKEEDLQHIEIKNTPDQVVKVVQGVEIIKIYDDVPYYEGEYEVTPKVTEQTLPTAQKFLEKDVKVEKIPYFEVSNNSGGMTASIGEV